MEKLLLLHGALGSQSQFKKLEEALRPYFEVITLDFYGHGSASFSDQPYSIAGFAEQVEKCIEEKNAESVNIFGYSMGGYVALYLALKHPEKVKRIFTLATKFDWTEESATNEVKMLDAEKIEAKVPAFAQDLANRHGAHYWKNVLRKTTDMMLELGREKALTTDMLKQIETRVQVAVGDCDQMVTLAETTEAYKALPNAQLLVLPKTVHPLERLAEDRLVFECRQFFTGK
jgi:pimeloyl-ACP methyl ester carboxylesterase